MPDELILKGNCSRCTIYTENSRDFSRFPQNRARYIGTITQEIAQNWAISELIWSILIRNLARDFREEIQSGIFPDVGQAIGLLRGANLFFSFEYSKIYSKS